MTYSSSMEHFTWNLDKLWLDIGEANVYANLIAHAIDKHQIQANEARHDQLRQLKAKQTKAF